MYNDHDEPRETDAPHRRHYHACEFIRGVGLSLESLARAFAQTGNEKVASELQGLASHLERSVAEAARAFGDDRDRHQNHASPRNGRVRAVGCRELAITNTREEG